MTPPSWISGVTGETGGAPAQLADEPLEEPEEEELEELDDEELEAEDVDEDEEAEDLLSDPVEDDDPEPEVFAVAGAGVLLEEEPRLSFR